MGGWRQCHAAQMTDVFKRSQLDVSDSQLRRLVASGRLERVCTGWYARPGANPDVVAARRFGGELTAHSLLRTRGVWTPHSSQLHVRVEPNAPGRRRAPGVRLYFLPKPVTAEEELLTAVWALALCSPLADVVIVLDSILERGLLDREVIERFAETHPILLKAAGLMTGLSQSGGETLVRLCLVSHQVKFTLQVPIDGVGRVDILVGDRLVIEVDGREHHLGDRFTADRVRDRELIRRCYLVFRISYDMLYRDWPATEQALFEIIRSGAHRWPRARTEK